MKAACVAVVAILFNKTLFSAPRPIITSTQRGILHNSYDRCDTDIDSDPLHNEETLSCTDDANERLVEVYCYFNAPINVMHLSISSPTYPMLG